MATAEPDNGARVIRAHVRARLLGLPLLTVDALVDVAPPDAPVADGHRGSWAVPRRPHRRDGVRLRQATVLLQEGGQCLGEARALRRRLDPGPAPP